MNGEWFYADKGKQVGPVSYGDIVQRIARSHDKLLVWCPGMEDWMDARNLSQFAHLFDLTPPPIKQQVEQREFISLSATAQSDVHAWRRYFARMFDYYIFTMVASFGLAVLFPTFFDQLMSIKNDQASGLIYIALFIPFETFCLNAFGTTLGKSLYGIKFHQGNGKRDWWACARRSILVWIKGIGFGIPIITIITAITAYNNLKNKGSTTWDKDIGWTVSHSEITPVRWVAILMSWSAIVAVTVFAMGQNSSS